MNKTNSKPPEGQNLMNNNKYVYIESQLSYYKIENIFTYINIYLQWFGLSSISWVTSKFFGKPGFLFRKCKIKFFNDILN